MPGALHSALSTHSANPRRNLRSVSIYLERSYRAGVTIVEVLFAMFVVLFGLVGLVVLLPLAGRQASDSYSMVHGSAAMENAAAVMVSSFQYLPTSEKPWWFADDEAPPPRAGFGPGVGFAVPFGTEDRQYRRARSMDEMLSFVQQRYLRIFGTAPNPIRIETARREGLAYGFCIDPGFCARQFEEGWIYGVPYTPARSSATQGLFRRTRMPFFDESTVMTSATSFGQNTAFNYPKLLRVSFEGGVVNKGGVASSTLHVQPKPMMGPETDIAVGTLGDCQQVTEQEDKSFGALRGFFAAAGIPVQPISSQRISWLATLTPSEQTNPGIVPQHYNLSFVVFSNRDRTFDAAPLSVTGSEKFATGEKMCFATAAASTTPTVTQCGQLAYSQNGGAMEIKLWSDDLTDTSIRIGDWVMLSRRMVQGNNFPTAPTDRSLYKVTHRHRWYRVIGVDSVETWPRVIRIQGEPWDYPEISTVAMQGNANAPVVSNDTMSAVVDLNFVATTATIFRDVGMVYDKVVSIK